MRISSLLCTLSLILAFQPGCLAQADTGAGGTEPSPTDDAAICFNRTGTELDVFTKPKQAIVVGDQKCGSLVLGAPQAIVSAAEKQLALYRGTITVDTGATPTTIRLKEAVISLGPNSTASINYVPEQTLTIRALGSTTTMIARISSGSKSGIAIKLSSGQEISANLFKHELRRCSFAPLSGETELYISPKVSGMFSKLYDRLRTRSGSNVSSHAECAVSELSAPLRLLGSIGTKFATLPTGQVDLICGRLFASTSSKDVIHTQLGDALLQADSMASIERWQGQLRVASYSKPETVAYSGRKQIVALRWGQEMVVTDHCPTWADLLPNDGVARRNFQKIDSSGLNCTLNDFLLASALKNHPHLSAIRKPTSKEGNKLKSQLLKTAVALDLVTGQKGRYLTYDDLCAQVASKR